MSEDELPFTGKHMDIQEILALLPHRYPFLLLDRVLACVPGQHLLAIKSVSINEPFFQGHFPGKPVMPGVLIIEALAQATGVLAVKTANKMLPEGHLPFLVGIDKVRFRRVVVPGDRLDLRVELLKEKQNVWRFSGEACVQSGSSADAEREVVCTAQLMSAIRPLPAHTR